MKIAAVPSIPVPNPPVARSFDGRLLQRSCTSDIHRGRNGERCGECSSSAPRGQLAIGRPDDPREAEADRLADQVLAARKQGTISGASMRIQRFATPPRGGLEAAPPSVFNALAGPGSPLAPALRQDMEQRFGHDFSRVRVHSDTAAQQSTRDVSANAYTVGHHLVFAPGCLRPADSRRRLRKGGGCSPMS
jgi:hypothetical protein